MLVVVPARVELESVDCLTESEMKVAVLAASGVPNRTLAAMRGSSERTIANQLASVYRKLRVRGRRELRARMTEPERC